MSEITAYKRSTTADEGVMRFFNTVDLIVNHLKKVSDRKKINELIGEKNNLSKLLEASCAVHSYYFLGIRTKSEEMVSNVLNMKAFEMVELREIFSEFEILIGDALNSEISLHLLILDYEKKLLNEMMKSNDPNNQKFIYKFSSQIEQNLVKSLNIYPNVHWIDHIGQLTGLNSKIKHEIFKKSAQLKPTSIEIEKLLKNEQQSDLYVELTALTNLVEEMKKRFEFSSIRDLKLDNFPIRKILNHIIKYRLNLYPISKVGLKSFFDATELKIIIYNRLSNANNNKIDYKELEKQLIDQISKEIIIQAKKSPNEFVYYLQNLFEIDFEELHANLYRFGVSNVPLFCHIANFDLNEFQKQVKFNSLTKMAFKKISKQNNIIFQAQKELNNFKLKSIFKSDKSIEELLLHHENYEINTIKKVCESADIKYESLIDLFEKKQIIKKVIQKKFPLKGPISSYAMVFEFSQILKNLSREVYFTFFRKISHQIARILESFVKLIEDKKIFMHALKRINNISKNEEWVIVKIEELIINRIINRQKELSNIFNARNNTFFVNSFILSRLLNINMKEAKKILKNEPSSLYSDVLELNLPNDKISPVSYIMAYDILNRLKDHQEFRKIRIEQKIEEKRKGDKKKQEKINTGQRLNTLNWIEKKINSTLISVSAISSNPTTYYWNKKDQEIVTENIITHSDLKSRKICSLCGIDVDSSHCKDHPNSSKDANPLELFSQYYIFALNRINKHWPIKIPPYQAIISQIKGWMNKIMIVRLSREINVQDSFNMIEGEKRELAQIIAKNIGKRLDKCIYKKFKKNLRRKKKYL